MTDQTRTNAEFFARSCAVIPGGVNSSIRAFKSVGGTPYIVDRAQGPYVFDVEGTRYFDLVQSYGDEFATTLERLPPGEWRALQTREGWRAMRLDAVVAGKAANFDSLVGVVTQDWTDATMAELRTQAVRERGKKYKLKFEQAAS